MIRKSDEYFKRNVRVWQGKGHYDNEVAEYVQREIWWLFYILPIYIRETVVDKPR